MIIQTFWLLQWSLVLTLSGCWPNPMREVILRKNASFWTFSPRGLEPPPPPCFGHAWGDFFPSIFRKNTTLKTALKLPKNYQKKVESSNWYKKKLLQNQVSAAPLTISGRYWKKLFYLNGISRHCKLSIRPYRRNKGESRFTRNNSLGRSINQTVHVLFKKSESHQGQGLSENSPMGGSTGK